MIRDSMLTVFIGSTHLQYSNYLWITCVGDTEYDVDDAIDNCINL